MLSKNCILNGQISIKLKNDKFEFMPICYNGQIAVLIDVSGEKTDTEKLSLTIKKDDGASNSIVMSLIKTDLQWNKDELLELSLESNSFSIDPLNPENSEYIKKAQVFGTYSAKSSGCLVEAVFFHNDSTTMSVLCDPRNNVHEAYKWLCTFWRRYYPSGEICISFDDNVVDETRKFTDFAVEGIVNLYVAEKCCLTPITEDNGFVAQPWNQDGRAMVLHLSRILGVESGEIRLYDKARTLLSLDTELDIEGVRSAGTSLGLEMFYEVIGATIRCAAMIDDGPLLEVMLVKELTLRELKERLAFKMKIDWTRLIICGGDSLMLTVGTIERTEKLKYCSGLPQPNISQKEVVGQGGFGRIYACTETSSGDIFALKEFTASLDSKTKFDIMKEVLVMSRVAAHDNIVRFLKIYVDRDDISIAMEYMAGGSLRSYLTGPLKEEEIRRFSRDILQGLSHLHGLKIMHRDIKGDNVMLTADHQTAKLCDFGLSKILTDFSKSGKHTGECGTYRWMAPEVIRGEVYSFRADIWSFGATMVQMITGCKPCSDIDNEYSALYYIGENKSLPFESSHLSEELKELVGACLGATSAERPPCDTLLSLPFFQEKTVHTEMEL